MTGRCWKGAFFVASRSSRPLALLIPLASIAVSLTAALPARGADVPFVERLISNEADGAESVFAVDLDGDGDADVLSASSLDDKIAWYESDGGSPPTFTERVISTTADGATSVFATDVDGDGDTDVLSASSNDDKIAWYENDGGSPPTFTERAISISADGAHSVFATDVDGDGDTDVLSASRFDDKIAWYENDGGSPPNFTERVISTDADGAWSVFATDLDGDGDTDVLSSSLTDDKIAWYENNGGSPPNFTERVISFEGGNPWSVFATDVDGDGDTDVLSASQNVPKIAWYENDGGSPPTFRERVISSVRHPAQSVFAADLDGDGDTDVLAGSRFDTKDSKIAWYESNGGSPPVFTERVISTAAHGSPSVFAIDLDGDGDVDVLSASANDDKVAWYENTPRSSTVLFTERVISTSAETAVSVFAGDMDGDGDTDVLSASRNDDKIAWYESDGGSPPTFTEHVISTDAKSAWSVFAADIDGDGNTDVVSGSGLDDKVAWYESDGGSPPTFTERVISTTADETRSVFAIDVDGDGDTDVLSASSRDDKIAWYENDGLPTPTFTEHVISTTADGANSVFAIDLDADGDIDVLSSSFADHTIAWYENDGLSPPAFTERVISTDVISARAVFAADMDGDGHIDVLSASRHEGKIAWYENNGESPPTFSERVITVATPGVRYIFAKDVDGDGDIDVLSASWDLRTPLKIAWFENDGGYPPIFTERFIANAADGAGGVFATDLDGDGDTDVLAALGRDNKIAWYENNTCGDAVVDPGEECDRGGEAADCDADCTMVECGDRTLNITAGEECDDGGESGNCDVDCTAAACGDATVNVTAGEDCDDAGESQVCDLDCTLAECGDGTLNTTAGEECDDGDANNNNDCTNACGDANCGDGVIWNQGTGTEQCDDGPGCTDCCLDQDEDGACDDVDDCPTDPNKTDPGICGCGVSDKDTDDDGTADCNDSCPTDPDKIEPGICGCGVSDEDMDDDGKADCTDRCPNDPDKLDPGVCGCGVVDEGDIDGDTVLDCVDRCPDEDDTIDVDRNGIRDCQQYESVPAASRWGIVSLVLLLLAGLTIKLRDPLARILAR